MACDPSIDTLFVFVEYFWAKRTFGLSPIFFFWGIMVFWPFQIRIPYPCVYLCHPDLLFWIKLITRFIWIQAEMWDNIHKLTELTEGYFLLPQSSISGTNVSCCWKQFVLGNLRMLLVEPVNVALEKLSPDLPSCSTVLDPLPHQAAPHSTAQMYAQSWDRWKCLPLLSSCIGHCKGHRSGWRALESWMVLDVPCNKIIIKIIQGYESHKSLTISESKFGLFRSF